MTSELVVGYIAVIFNLMNSNVTGIYVLDTDRIVLLTNHKSQINIIDFSMSLVINDILIDIQFIQLRTKLLGHFGAAWSRPLQSLQQARYFNLSMSISLAALGSCSPVCLMFSKAMMCFRGRFFG